MNTSAIVLMVVVWTVISIFTGYFLAKVMSPKKKQKNKCSIAKDKA